MIRYLVADLVKSQRFLPPMMLYVALLGVLNAGDPGKPPGTSGVSAMVLFPIAAWLTVIVVNNEDPVQRRITLAAVGGWRRLLVGLLGVTGLVNGVLVLLSVGGVALVNIHYQYAVPVLAMMTVAHLISVATGVALGLVCARPLVPTTGWSMLAVVAVSLVAIVANAVPPVGPTAKVLFNPDQYQVVPYLAIQALVAVTLLGVAVVATYLIGRRRF